MRKCWSFNLLKDPERCQRTQEAVQDIGHRPGPCRKDSDRLRLRLDQVGYAELRDYVQELRSEEPEQQLPEEIIRIHRDDVAHEPSMTYRWAGRLGEGLDSFTVTPSSGLNSFRLPDLAVALIARPTSARSP